MNIPENIWICFSKGIRAIYATGRSRCTWEAQVRADTGGEEGNPEYTLTEMIYTLGGETVGRKYKGKEAGA